MEVTRGEMQPRALGLCTLPGCALKFQCMMQDLLTELAVEADFGHAIQRLTGGKNKEWQIA